MESPDMALMFLVCQVQSPSPSFRRRSGTGCPRRLLLGEAASGWRARSRRSNRRSPIIGRRVPVASPNEQYSLPYRPVSTGHVPGSQSKVRARASDLAHYKY